MTIIANRIGRTALIRYRGGARGVDLIDDHSTGDPLRIVIGDHRVPVGIEEALASMEAGECRRVEIPAERGYGAYDKAAVQWYPRMLVERGYDLRVGDTLTWTSPDGLVHRPARVVDATADEVRIDLNHPFAGKTLEYDIELVDLL